MQPPHLTAGAPQQSRQILHPRSVVLGLRYARVHGVRALISRAVLRLSPKPPYQAWVARYDTLRDKDKAAIAAHLGSLHDKPTISILMSIGGEMPPFLRNAVESVVAQLYPDWELCLAADARCNAQLQALLDEVASTDPRIKLVAGAGNAALAAATGEFVAAMAPDDQLPPHALYMIAVEVNEHPDADIIYSDEDRIDAEGRRRDPCFKPDWSPALFQSQNMVAHLAVYRAAAVRTAGGFREEFGASRDYDLTLRLSTRTGPDRIRHIPYILYHARTPQFPSKPLAADETAMRALRDHLAAADDAAEVLPGSFPGCWRVKRPLPQPVPKVSLIVPTRDRIELLRPCIEGLLHRTRYPNLEIVIVDNESRDPATLAYFDELGADDRVRVLRAEGAFNFSALNNRAAAIAKGELIGLVNNDIDVIEPDWLEEMVTQVVQPGIGAVGAKLYYSDDTIQHAGVVLGVGGVAGHAHRKFSREAAGYCGRLHVVHDVSCVTAACMLMPKKVFEEVGGLDEVNLKVALNDVDLCIKIREAGHRIVWTPYAELYHRESASRGSDLTRPHIERFSREVAYIKKRWGALLQRDPFYNPNLSLSDETFSLTFPPRLRKPWETYKEGTGRPAAR